MFGIEKLISHEQTGAKILRLGTQYAGDLGEKARWPLEKFFDFVARLPYIPDPRGLEFVSRPKYALDPAFPVRDCDDKAVLIVSWAHKNGVPVRLIAAGKERNFHHVYPELYISGRWIVTDATLPKYKIGYNGLWKKRKVIAMAYLGTLEGEKELGSLAVIGSAILAKVASDPRVQEASKKALIAGVKKVQRTVAKKNPKAAAKGRKIGGVITGQQQIGGTKKMSRKDQLAKAFSNKRYTPSPKTIAAASVPAVPASISSLPKWVIPAGLAGLVYLMVRK